MSEIGVLLDLKKKLAWIEYDKLNLISLDSLRIEVENRIQKLIHSSKPKANESG